MAALVDIIAQFPPDMPDWQVANTLNAPDPTLPPIVDLQPTSIGYGTIMTALGLDAGAALLDELEVMAQSIPAIKWTLRILERGNLDLSTQAARDQVDALVAAGKIDADQAATLKALAEFVRHPSWAEANGVTVSAREVGLARGAKA